MRIPAHRCITLLILAAGCGGEERAPESESHESFAAYRACLVGGRLEPGETLSQRMEDIALAFPEPSQDWPERCLELGNLAYRASEDAPLLRAAMQGQRENPNHDDEDWILADRVVTRDAPESVIRPPPPARPIEPEAMPVLAPSGFGSHRVVVSSTGPATRVLLRDRALFACEIDPAGRRARCRELVGLPGRNSNTLLLDGELGAPFLVSSPEGTFVGADGALRRVGQLASGRGHISANGTVYLVEQERGMPVLITVRGDERSERPIPGALRGSYHQTQIRDGQLIWVVGSGEEYHLRAAALAPEGAVEGRELGPLETPLRIGAACVAGWGTAIATWDQPAHDLQHETLRTVRLFFDRQDGATFVDTRVGKPRSTTSLLVFRNHGRAPELTCDDDGVILHVVGEEGLEWQRCTPSGCEEHEVSLDPIGGHVVGTAFLGDQLLVLRSHRGARIRMAEPTSIVDAPERLVARPRDAASASLQRVAGGALIWIFNDRDVRALHVSASGQLSPVAP